MPATAAAKSALRTALRQARRDQVAARDRAADADALARAVATAVRARCAARGERACRVAAYEARPTEPPTDRLVQALRADGHQVILPVTLADKSLDWVDAAGGPPLGPQAIDDCAVVVSPGLAVDGLGHRLGQGGGSYDRALEHAGSAGRPPFVVTLLYDDELLAEGAVPVEDHDRRVDAVATPGRGVVPVGVVPVGEQAPGGPTGAAPTSG